MKFIVTGGNVHDCKQAENLLSSTIHRGVKVLADKAYDADKIIKYITNQSGIAVIPNRNNRNVKREYDKEVYKNRNQIERFFNRLKQFRRIATRYDKLCISFLSLVQLAATLIIIPKFPPIV